MATFYSCSNDKRDIMQTLYMRETGNSSNLESSVNGNTLYVGYSSSGPYSEILAGNSGQSQQNCMELPVCNTPVTQNSVVGGLDISASQIMEQTYNAWRDGKDELFMQVGGPMSGADGHFSHSINDEMGLHKQLRVLTGQNSSLASPSQGLSLTLSTQIAVPSFPYQSANSDISIVSSHQSASVNSGSCGDDKSRNKPMHGNLSHGLSTLTSFIPNSKYLKVAQQLFDEVVSVSEALKNKEEKCQILNSSIGTSSCKEIEGSRSDGVPANNQQSLANLTTELGHPERQELQNRITKLLAMLDEIDRRYKQYYHQMQTVVSWFDVIAGAGAAKPYTALALQTISRHFRCLRDAIGCQIQSLRKSLGEEDNFSGKGGGLPRLRHIDLQLRQQRAMQQLGMMQPHAWRPQRGLPETSVSILRAWLFEHFLHPYPNDSDKLMLARQTGLSRSQVSNWFINARVRLWKPMIEEMYKEETGDTEMDSNSSSDNVSKGRNDLKSSEDREDFQSPDAERCQTNSDLDISRTASGYHYKPNMDDAYVNFKLSDQGPVGEDPGLLHDAFRHSDASDRFMAYQMADLRKYGNGGVSLTLGLQHCNVGMASSSQQGFLTMREEDMYATTTTSLHVGAEATDYDYMNPMDRPQAFGGSLN